MQQQTTGQKKERKMVEVTGNDLWKDSDFYAPGMTENSEHMLAFPAGMTLEGTLNSIREANTEGKGEKTYLCMTKDDGTRFKVRAPGKLEFEVRKAQIGQYIRFTYLGKTYVESLKADVHDFKVWIEEGTNLQ